MISSLSESEYAHSLLILSAYQKHYFNDLKTSTDSKERTPDSESAS